MPFQLIFCDIWGPHSTSTYTGAYYFLTIVDDNTRCTWVYLMRHKLKAFQLLKNFYFLIKTQFHTQIKKFVLIKEVNFYQIRCNLFFMSMASCMNALVLKHLNKMGQQNASIDIFQKLHVHYVFKHIYLCLSGEIVF